ncbi:uncharacterized protein LY79DRAFT_550777 [Colletotrichum navitas]|uniref:Uncharacterized protein n=1 Tax=Colletotrichum navitas TaxID=681940 RepID=A0AAD8Q1E5_9PEZI|nr:uncharacterized protein LY79DRAFT_550777 [Colletotrichum navitas]KAK1594067.1 hypothetical protein LY79DRAFT_550777 [Colletotrichum navitas]
MDVRIAARRRAGMQATRKPSCNEMPCRSPVPSIRHPARGTRGRILAQTWTEQRTTKMEVESNFPSFCRCSPDVARYLPTRSSSRKNACGSRRCHGEPVPVSRYPSRNKRNDRLCSTAASYQRHGSSAEEAMMSVRVCTSNCICIRVSNCTGICVFRFASFLRLSFPSCKACLIAFDPPLLPQSALRPICVSSGITVAIHLTLDPGEANVDTLARIALCSLPSCKRRS